MSLGSEGPIGYIDTNVFIHALTNDPLHEECLGFLNSIQVGSFRVRIHPLVIHELTYALPRYLKQMTKDDIGKFVLSVLSWPGVISEDPYIGHAVRVWMKGNRIQFVDAYLGVVAQAQGAHVYTKNVRHFEEEGFDVPRSLTFSSL